MTMLSMTSFMKSGVCGSVSSILPLKIPGLFNDDIIPIQNMFPHRDPSTGGVTMETCEVGGGEGGEEGPYWEFGRGVCLSKWFNFSHHAVLIKNRMDQEEKSRD